MSLRAHLGAGGAGRRGWVGTCCAGGGSTWLGLAPVHGGIPAIPFLPATASAPRGNPLHLPLAVTGPPSSATCARPASTVETPCCANPRSASPKQTPSKLQAKFASSRVPSKICEPQSSKQNSRAAEFQAKFASRRVPSKIREPQSSKQNSRATGKRPLKLQANSKQTPRKLQAICVLSALEHCAELPDAAGDE